MTQFERTYLLSRPRYLAVSYNDGSGRADEVINMSDNPFNRSHNELAMQMQYRELDRLSLELEKQIQAVKALRTEMEKYKVDFSLSVEDEATKKIQEVIKGIDKMLK